MGTEMSMLPDDMKAMAPKYGNAEALERMSAGAFLPRIQHLQAQSKIVTRMKIPAGSFVAVKGKDTLIKSYPDKIEMLVINWRPKAMKFGADGKGVAFYNPKTDAFAAVEREACKKPRPKGYLYGPEYLIYLPDVNEICTFHFSTPTMRNRSLEMVAQIGKPTSVLSQFIQSGGNEWYGPDIHAASSPIGLPDQGSDEWNALMQRITGALPNFLNPPDEGVTEEVVEGAESAPASSRPQ